MDVDEAALRDLQQRSGKDPAVRDDDAEVQLVRCDRLEELRIANLRRLHDGQREPAPLHCDLGRMHLHPAPRRLVRLRHDQRDLVVAGERFERGDRERGGAEEGDTQGDAILSVAGCGREPTATRSSQPTHGFELKCVPVAAVLDVCVACWLSVGIGG